MVQALPKYVVWTKSENHREMKEAPQMGTLTRPTESVDRAKSEKEAIGRVDFTREKCALCSSPLFRSRELLLDGLDIIRDLRSPHLHGLRLEISGRLQVRDVLLYRSESSLDLDLVLLYFREKIDNFLRDSLAGKGLIAGVISRAKS